MRTTSKDITRKCPGRLLFMLNSGGQQDHLFLVLTSLEPSIVPAVWPKLPLSLSHCWDTIPNAHNWRKTVVYFGSWTQTTVYWLQGRKGIMVATHSRRKPAHGKAARKPGSRESREELGGDTLFLVTPQWNASSDHILLPHGKIVITSSRFKHLPKTHLWAQEAFDGGHLDINYSRSWMKITWMTELISCDLHSSGWV